MSYNHELELFISSLGSSDEDVDIKMRLLHEKAEVDTPVRDELKERNRMNGNYNADKKYILAHESNPYVGLEIFKNYKV